MKTDQQQLLKELNQLTDNASEHAIAFRKLPLDQLNFKKTQEAWSILECIEHLNLYGQYYLPEIERALGRSSKVGLGNVYKSSFLGDFFADSIKAENTKKMKATRMMIPKPSDLSYATIDVFLNQLEQLKALLDRAKERDLVKVKTSISLTKLVNLRLGDTIRFLVYHNERHILQAERTHKAILQERK